MRRRRLVSGITSAMRRSQERRGQPSRTARVRRYDAAGHAELLDPLSEPGRSLLAAADRLLDAARGSGAPEE